MTTMERKETEQIDKNHTFTLKLTFRITTLKLLMKISLHAYIVVRHVCSDMWKIEILFNFWGH